MRTYTHEALEAEKRKREEKILRKWRDMQSKGKARSLLFRVYRWLTLLETFESDLVLEGEKDMPEEESWRW